MSATDTLEVDPALGGLLADLEPAEAGAERPSERVAREGAGYHARLIQIYRRLAREDDIGRLLAQVVDAIMELCHAERGVAVLLPWREGQARVEVVRELATGSDGASFSRSIIDRVLATGEPILSVDAASDDRFDGSRSISHLHLRSVLGIPLFEQHGEAVDEGEQDGGGAQLLPGADRGQIPGGGGHGSPALATEASRHRLEGAAAAAAMNAQAHAAATAEARIQRCR